MEASVIGGLVVVGVAVSIYLLIKKHKAKGDVTTDRRVRPPRDPNKPPTHEK